MTPLIIDVEASGFGGTSYPIEIGVALDDGHKYCALIIPEPEWTHWDPEAERVHRIPRDILETYGRPSHDVAETLNELLASRTVYTDGWVVDKPWLTTLFHATRTPMQFQVSPLEMILSESQMACWHGEKDALVASLDSRPSPRQPRRLDHPGNLQTDASSRPFRLRRMVQGDRHRFLEAGGVSLLGRCLGQRASWEPMADRRRDRRIDHGTSASREFGPARARPQLRHGHVRRRQRLLQGLGLDRRRRAPRG